MKFFIFLLVFLYSGIILSQDKISDEVDLEKNIYKYCENTQNIKVENGTCKYLLKIKTEKINSNGKEIDYNNVIFDNSKQYHLGVVFGEYRFKREYLLRNDEPWMGNRFYEDSFFVQAIYFEYRLLPVIYLGARIGLLKTRWDESGEYLEAYLTLNPFFMLKYFNMNISLGALGYNIGAGYSTQFTPSINLNLGFKLLNSIRVNFEIGSYEHYGVILGILL